MKKLRSTVNENVCAAVLCYQFSRFRLTSGDFLGYPSKKSFICGSEFELCPISTFLQRFPDISAKIGQISNLAPKMEDNFSWIFEKISEYESEPRKLKILNDRPDIFASYSKNGGPPF